MVGCGRPSAGHREPRGLGGVPDIGQQIAAICEGTSFRIVAQQPLTDGEWESLRGLGGLRELVVERGVATDSRADILATLPDLERLVLRESPLGDVGFGRLAACVKLRDLNVPRAACTAAGIRALAGLEHLRSLRIGSDRLAGAEACAAVAALPHLRTLHLVDVPIGDEGLRALISCAGLWTLYLDGAGVSDGAWTEYFGARPHVHVHVDQAHHDRDPARGHD
ncbi:MAG: hypothetical protein EBR28_01335 [Planctomycetia bacterium]|nr:hypothetical protein [Planctomycetia bacterium]